MREFKFQENLAKIKIEGKVYEFDPADSERNDALLKAGKKLASFKPNKSSGAVVMTLSKELRDIVGVVLGKEAQAEIFKDRKPNIMQELRLISAMVDARNEAGVEAELNKLLGEFGAATLDE